MGADIAPPPCKCCTTPMQMLHWSRRQIFFTFSCFFRQLHCGGPFGRLRCISLPSRLRLLEWRDISTLHLQRRKRGGLRSGLLGMISNTRQRIGSELRALREAQGLSTRELAERSGLIHSHIVRIESGRYGFSIDTLDKLTTALGAVIKID